MMEICKQEYCTACEACRSVCPSSAINMKIDIKGFLYPVIDEKKCIHCDLCKKTCPVNLKNADYTAEKRIYAAWLKDKKVRKESSSGGAFSAFSDYIINKDGVVFGARWEEDFSVIIDYCIDKKELHKFRGSKYVQARIEDSFIKAKNFLNSGKYVLFTGTPCQIDGLKKYLGKEYNNLITIDLICHGVPSPMIFKDYIKYIEKRHNDKVKEIYFRYKKPAWSSCSVYIKLMCKEPYIKSTQIDPYFIGFDKNFILRDSCYKCKYANLNRVGDITVADFWGYRASNWKMRNFEKGCSMIIINTQKGLDIFQNIKNAMIYERKTINDAIPGNKGLIKPYLKAKNSEKFWKDYLISRDFENVSKEYFIPIKNDFRNTLGRLKNRYVFLIPESILNLTRRLKQNKSKHQKQDIP